MRQKMKDRPEKDMMADRVSKAASRQAMCVAVVAVEQPLGEARWITAATQRGKMQN